MQIRLLVFILLSLLFNCNNKLENESRLQDGIIAEYKNHKLIKADIKKILPENISKKDSSELVSAYVEKWMKEKLLLEEAKNRLEETKKSEIEQKVKLYKEDLLLNEYTNYLIENLEDDSIQESVIRSYYNQNKNNFILRQDLVRFVFIITNSESEREAMNLINSYSNSDQNKLNALAKKNEFLFYQTPKTSWDTTEDLIARVGTALKLKVNSGKFSKNQIFRINQNNQIELLKILDVRKKETIAPLNYVKTSIKNRLINKRKLILLNKLKNQLYNNAKENGQFNVFEPK